MIYGAVEKNFITISSLVELELAPEAQVFLCLGHTCISHQALDTTACPTLLPARILLYD